MYTTITFHTAQEGHNHGEYTPGTRVDCGVLARYATIMPRTTQVCDNHAMYLENTRRDCGIPARYVTITPRSTGSIRDVIVAHRVSSAASSAISSGTALVHSLIVYAAIAQCTEAIRNEIAYALAELTLRLAITSRTLQVEA